MKIAGLSALAADVVAACQILDGKELVEAYGHVSARIPGSDLLLVTPRGGLGFVRARDLLVMDLTGRVVRGRSTPPLEMPMHTVVYRRRPEIGALCRTHSRMAVAWSTLGRSLPPAHGFGSFLGPGVPVFPKPDLITTEALGAELAETLGAGEAVLLRGNGTLVVGRTLPEACVRAIFLEESARIQCVAAGAGQPLAMSDAEIRRRTDVPYDHYGRAWNYYTAKYAEGRRPRGEERRHRKERRGR
jgi:ribulose-5-phosphate 4-epimerase/fuculose-1-phosphate aldolase